MKIIVGLGNPGQEYINTRHNAGYRVVEETARRLGDLEEGEGEFKKDNKFKAEALRIGDRLLLKPVTYMNRSGEAVAEAVGFYKVRMEDLWVIHDDLDIQLGEYKIQRGTGPKVHNGVNSIETALGEKDFNRVRVGIDNRTAEMRGRISGEEYVLGRLTKEEEEVIDRVGGEIAQALARLV